MKNLLSTFIFINLFFCFSYAQTTALQCMNAEVICDFNDLDGLSFTMPVENSPGSQPIPVCPDGGYPHNISWFGFIAHEGDYTIKLYGDNCSGSTTGLEGIQYGVYTDCTFTESVTCNPSCSLDTFLISNDNLVAGNTYYMFVDGCSGSVCEIFIDVEGEYEGNYCGPVAVDEEDIAKDYQSTLSIYPNPASGQIYLESKFEFNEVVVYNTSGEVKLIHRLEVEKSNLELNIEGWDKGMYIVGIRKGGRAYFSKFIVE